MYICIYVYIYIFCFTFYVLRVVVYGKAIYLMEFYLLKTYLVCKIKSKSVWFRDFSFLQVHEYKF